MNSIILSSNLMNTSGDSNTLKDLKNLKIIGNNSVNNSILEEKRTVPIIPKYFFAWLYSCRRSPVFKKSKVVQNKYGVIENNTRNKFKFKKANSNSVGFVYIKNSTRLYPLSLLGIRKIISVVSL
jgi:hypothetical protein